LWQSSIGVKRIDITFPKESREKVQNILEEYGEDSVVFFDVERNNKDCLRCELVRDSSKIDQLIEDIRGITDIHSGDLIIEVLEQSTHVEKGKQHKGGSESLSTYEMYTKAFDFAGFSNTTWTLIALASVIAVIGLAIENIIVVIGAMVIAPMLGPFISTSFGLVIGDRNIIHESIKHSIGSLALAIGVALIIGGFFNIESNQLMEMVSNPGIGTVPLSLAVGSASALAFSSEAREVLAGVAVAIALVPPSAVAGISLAAMNLEMFLNVSLVILSNVMSLILAGSVTFLLLGIEPRTTYKKELSQEKLKKAFTVTATSILFITAAVGYLTYLEHQDSSVKSNIESALDSQDGEILKQEINVKDNSVEVNLILVESSYSEDELLALIESETDVPVNLEIKKLSTE